MRLIEIDDHGGLSLTQNLTQDIPSYAILSHTWGEDGDEVTLTDLKGGSGKSKAGYTKIQFCVEQARKDGLSHFWVDTCCIDQTNQVELAEAIVSMFRWYRGAAKCYVYLADVTTCKRDHAETEQRWKSAFRDSRWFTRGWTLQELLAPDHVEFYSRDKKLLGDKITLQQEIHTITKIPITAIHGVGLSNFSVDERMRWAAKRNTKKPEDKWYCLLGIFDVFMTPIYGEGDNAFIRLKDEIGKSCLRQLEAIAPTPSMSKIYDVDHRNVKSPSMTLETIETISLHDNRKLLLTSMSFEQMDTRRSTIKNAYSTTCKWLLKHDAFVDWMDPTKFDQHVGFLWINGKPGAGKSTLVKFAYANAKRNKSEHEVLISFFFNARGDELEKSTNGMYRALLFQLLNEVPDLQVLLDDLGFSSGQQDWHLRWTTEILCELLSSAVAKLGRRHLKCFIDALDECDDEEVREMVDFFEEVGQKALDGGIQLYICFASRHYPAIEIRYGRQLILEDEQGHGEDLAKYVQSHLRAGKGKYIEEIRTQIQEKANGVFMWAVLVVDLLNKEFRRGSIFTVKKRLQEIPSRLSDLFEDILRRDSENMSELLLCLQWIMFAKKPLKREEFYFAMVAGLDPDPENLVEWNPEHTTVDDMNRFVLNSSKGLAELTKSKQPTVQFIHESVRDYLVKDNGLCGLWPEYTSSLHSSSHDKLKQCCVNYLAINLSDHVSFDEPLPKSSSDSAKDLRQRLSAKFPFLDYASQYVLYHADEAAQEISQQEFLESFALRSWINISNSLEPHDIRRHTLDASLLYILAEKNLARLIRASCPDGPTMGAQGERYRYPLFAAFANGHQNAVRALLQQDENPLLEDFIADLKLSRRLSIRKDYTPLMWAIEQGQEALAEQIMAANDAFFNVKTGSLNGLMFQVISKGCGRILELLLARGVANVDDIIHGYGRLLFLAVQYKRKNIIQILLNRGANLNDASNSDIPILTKAALGGEPMIVELLLDHGADLEAKDHHGFTALIKAVRHEERDVVQLLLDKGAAIEASDKHGRTSLLHAVENADVGILQLLLTRGANVAVKDVNDKTALLWAIDHDLKLGVDYNFKYGADPFLDYQIQLMLLEQQNKERLMMARQLSSYLTGSLRRQIRLERIAMARQLEHGKQLKHPLRDDPRVIQLLLDKNADIEARDRDGMTALLSAILLGLDDIVQLLLDRGANINEEDIFTKTQFLAWQMTRRMPRALELERAQSPKQGRTK